MELGRLPTLRTTDLLVTVPAFVQNNYVFAQLTGHVADDFQVRRYVRDAATSLNAFGS